MEALLDRFYEDLDSALWEMFWRYIVKVSELKGCFFVLVKKPRGKILNEDIKVLCDNVQKISEVIYRKYPCNSSEFERQYFPYFKLVKSYGNYHYHFLVVKKDYASVKI